MITIGIFRKSTGKAAERKKVTVVFDGMFRGWSEGFTDDDGYCNIDVEPGYGKVYVDGDMLYEGRISGQKIVYI